ncbi:MAG: superoxide dismutase family protein, partial [Phenylobacterium sp.]
PYLKLKAESGAALADADGSALVIHAAADDHISQPIGGSGARIACGVLAGGAAADPHAGHAGH